MGAFLHMCQQFSGVNVVIFYSTKIFNDAGFHNAGIASAVTGLDFVASTLIGLFVVERLGRKTLFISSLAICALSFTGLAITRILASNNILRFEMSYVSLVFVLIYIFGYSIGLGPVPWLMLSEIFPSDVKGFFYGIVTAINWICKIMVTFSFPTLTRALHAYTFLPYAFFLYVAVIIAFFLVVETKGKTLEELTGDL
jgi:MFS family permease